MANSEISINDKLADVFRAMNTDWRLYDHVSSEKHRNYPFDRPTLLCHNRCMNVEQSRKLIELLRAYMVLQAENRSLAAILEYVETQGHLPAGGWAASLEAMRDLPEYQNISEQYESLFRRVEQATDVTEAEHLLETIPITRIPN